MSKKPSSTRRPRITRKGNDDGLTRQPAEEATPGRDTTREAKTIAGGKLADQLPDPNSVGAEPPPGSFEAAKRVPPPSDQPL